MPTLRTRSARAVLLVLALQNGGCAGAAPPPGPATQAADAAAPPGNTPAAPATAIAPLDPLAAQLQTYLRLLGPQGGTAAEFATFLRAVPADWPNRTVLARRLSRAIPAETDPATLAAFCDGAIPDARPSDDATLLVCAALPGGGGTESPSPTLVADVRRAWRAGLDDPNEIPPFLRDWGRFLQPDDQRARFDRLSWSGAVTLARAVLPLLPAADRPLATAILAARSGEPGAPALAAALPPAAQNDPGLLLPLSRQLRRADQLDDLLALWRSHGAAAETAAPATRLPALAAERDAAARSLLAAGRNTDALALAADPDPALPATALLDADFLRGWITLRRLNDPAGAEALFAPLAAADAPITRARGQYWIGRARLVRGNDPGARAAFAAAAAEPTAFYGQLALARLSPGTAATLLSTPDASPPGLATRLSTLPTPGWTAAEAVSVSGRPYARAAELLVSWNDPRHARPFLLALDRQLDTPADHALAAALALRLGLPEDAVAIARLAARRGEVLLEAGWPRPFAPPETQPPLPPGLALAVMRQESAFEPGVTSPAGARGLMQLTDATARTLSRALARPDLAGGGAALYDPQTNMLLGTADLSTLLARFGDQLPEAIAAYNAGPHRVDRWLAGDNMPPPIPENDPEFRLVDWIESIPYAETRNYVQRVIESMYVYRALPHG